MQNVRFTTNKQYILFAYLELVYCGVIYGTNKVYGCF